MSFLIDANIISEVRKGKHCNPALLDWWTDVEDDELWISVLVLGEMRIGVEMARSKDPMKSEALDAWHKKVLDNFADRILPVDLAVVEEWWRICAIRTVPTVDALLAATARSKHMTIETRNVKDFAGLNVQILNPFRT